MDAGQSYKRSKRAVSSPLQCMREYIFFFIFWDSVNLKGIKKAKTHNRLITIIALNLELSSILNFTWRVEILWWQIQTDDDELSIWWNWSLCFMGFLLVVNIKLRFNWSSNQSSWDMQGFLSTSQLNHLKIEIHSTSIIYKSLDINEIIHQHL